MPTNSFEDPIARVVQARTMPYRQGSKRGGGEHPSQFILQLFGSLLEEAKEHAVLPILYFWEEDCSYCFCETMFSTFASNQIKNMICLATAWQHICFRPDGIVFGERFHSHALYMRPSRRPPIHPNYSSSQKV